MRGSIAKILRGAAGLTREATVYEKPEIHHIAKIPTFETYVRTIRLMGPVLKLKVPNVHKSGRICNGPRRAVISHVATKIRYLPDGKTPAKPILNQKGEVAMELIPVAKPRRLKAGSPRRVYKTLKHLHRTVGLDVIFNELHKEMEE